MLRKKYPSDLTDTQWELIEKLIEKECSYQGGPKVTLDEYREILGVEQPPHARVVTSMIKVIKYRKLRLKVS
jgi:hypothetical protein